MLGGCRLNPAKTVHSFLPTTCKNGHNFLRHVPREREKNTSLFGNNHVGCERSESFFSLAGDMAEKIVSIFTRLN